MKKTSQKSKSAKIENRIREIREARGLSSRDLAEKLELSPSQMSRLENNKSPLSMKHILRLSAILGVDTSEIVDIPLNKRLKSPATDDTLVGSIIGWLFEASKDAKFDLSPEQMSKFAGYIYKEAVEAPLNFHETKYLACTVVRVTKMNAED